MYKKSTIKKNVPKFHLNVKNVKTGSTLEAEICIIATSWGDTKMYRRNFENFHFSAIFGQILVKIPPKSQGFGQKHLFLFFGSNTC